MSLVSVGFSHFSVAVGARADWCLCDRQSDGGDEEQEDDSSCGCGCDAEDGSFRGVHGGLHLRFVESQYVLPRAGIPPD